MSTSLSSKSNYCCIIVRTIANVNYVWNVSSALTTFGIYNDFCGILKVIRWEETFQTQLMSTVVRTMVQQWFDCCFIIGSIGIWNNMFRSTYSWMIARISFIPNPIPSHALKTAIYVGQSSWQFSSWSVFWYTSFFLFSWRLCLNNDNFQFRN
jgi:hypothetical protein